MYEFFIGLREYFALKFFASILVLWTVCISFALIKRKRMGMDGKVGSRLIFTAKIYFILAGLVFLLVFYLPLALIRINAKCHGIKDGSPNGLYRMETCYVSRDYVLIRIYSTRTGEKLYEKSESDQMLEDFSLNDDGFTYWEFDIPLPPSSWERIKAKIP
ncbi:hypothetical protein [Thauera sinica]|uniref:DUF5673 domain-containing protein n=1 Tax=Thauera sinica TaxID=2665146 RepID=A0ABW1AQY5_9RHOO|nr:hypothetical protein [Thauera sp. K11]